ncbi:hypothetical protein [Brevundimonas sp. R86498]|uniref:hypothetical protein n=1 Tax=Brevundimonas sp. R86498 TaxID=3093845 RepID=UPI0037C966FF
MARVPAALALMMAMALSACGSPETPPATEPAATAVEQTPVMPDDAPPQEEGVGVAQDTGGTEGGSCTDSVGSAAAIRLAERCTMVSPASHPPCNPDNPCALIQDEIDRACGQYGPDEAKPAECAA